MAIQGGKTVKGSDSVPIQPIGDSAMDALEAAMDELGGGMESSAGDDTVDAADSMDDSGDVDLEAMDDEIADETGDGEEEEQSEEEQVEDDVAGLLADTQAPRPGKKREVDVDITDDQGKRTVKIDLNDVEGRKRDAQQAAGARKMYPAYKAEKARAAALTTELGAAKESLSHYEKLEAVYEKHGIDGVAQLLEGKTINALMDERAKFNEQWKKWSPAQQEAYTAHQTAQRERQSADDLRAQLAALTTKSKADTYGAKVEALTGVAHTEFHKNSFKGKLGNRADEIRLDKLLWRNQKAEMDELEADGVQLTPAVVARVARETAELLSKTAAKAADKVVAKKIDKKKAAATNAAQAQIRSGNARTAAQTKGKGVDISSTEGIAALMHGAVHGGKRK